MTDKAFDQLTSGCLSDLPFSYCFLHACSSPATLASLCIPISESLDVVSLSLNTFTLNIHKTCPFTSSTPVLKRHISERTSFINLSKIANPSLTIFSHSILILYWYLLYYIFIIFPPSPLRIYGT